MNFTQYMVANSKLLKKKKPIFLSDIPSIFSKSVINTLHTVDWIQKVKLKKKKPNR